MTKTKPSKPALSLNIEAGCVGFVSEFASTEEARYYLNGVYVEPAPTGGVIAVTTDGHRLVAIHDVTGRISEPTILQFPRAFLATLRRTPDLRLIIAGDGSIARCGSAVADVGVIDGTFPEWRKVIPAPSPNLASAVFQARYLGSFRGLASWLSGGGAGPMLVRQSSESGPALISFASARAVGVLMPMSRGCAVTLETLPAWLDSPKPRIRVKATSAMKEAA